VILARAYTKVTTKIAAIHQRRTDVAVIRCRIERSGFLEEGFIKGHPKNVKKDPARTDFPALGSPERKIHILKFQITHRNEPSFRNFSKDLYQFLTYLVLGPEACGDSSSIRSLDDNGMASSCFLHQIHSPHDLQIRPFKNIKIQYRSLSSMKLITEYLRCAESFHKRPRYDECLVLQPDGVFAVVRLCFIFACKAANRDWKLARVRLLKTCSNEVDPATGMRRVKDERYGFIELKWIVRSLFLSKTHDRVGEYFVNDLVDSEDDVSDVYLRLRSLSSKTWY
jgi:hypothetical protein